PATRRLLVRATFEKKDGVLKPEMFANVTLYSNGDLSRVDTLGIPRSAVIYEGDISRVWVARDDQSIELRQVRLGLTNDKMIQVLAGVRVGERVVSRGSLFIDRAATGGGMSFNKINIQSYPDPVPPLVHVITQSAGQSAEEIERYITIPIEGSVSSVPYLTAMRTISLFGLSDVKLQFTYDLTYEEAEQKVLNRLSQLAPLPNQAQPTISPTSPIG